MWVPSAVFVKRGSVRSTRTSWPWTLGAATGGRARPLPVASDGGRRVSGTRMRSAFRSIGPPPACGLPPRVSHHGGTIDHEASSLERGVSADRSSGPRLKFGGDRCRYTLRAAIRGGARRDRPAQVRTAGCDQVGCRSVRGRVQEARSRGEMARSGSITDHPLLEHDGRADAGHDVWSRRRRGRGARCRLRSRCMGPDETEVRATPFRASTSGAGARVEPARTPSPQASAVERRSCVDDHVGGKGTHDGGRPPAVRPR
jgi:hypothetical protein